MAQSDKKRKQQKKVQKREQTKVEPPDQAILDSIGSPNVWTPKIEDAWLEELRGIPAGDIYRKFPPLKKPPSVRKRGQTKGSGWGDM
jgi:hypothetical protein